GPAPSNRKRGPSCGRWRGWGLWLGAASAANARLTSSSPGPACPPSCSKIREIRGFAARFVGTLDPQDMEGFFFAAAAATWTSGTGVEMSTNSLPAGKEQGPAGNRAGPPPTSGGGGGPGRRDRQLQGRRGAGLLTTEGGIDRPCPPHA